MAVRLEAQSIGTREAAKFFVGYAVGQSQVADDSGKDTAWRLANSAKIKAPYDTGDLSESIKFRRIKKGKYLATWQVYVGEPVRNMPRGRIYPYVQERGYTPHWIHTSMIAEGARRKYQRDQWANRFIFVSKFTPYLYPALMEMRGDPPKIIKKRLGMLADKAGSRAGVKRGG